MEAERFPEAFRERLAKFGLELHPEKTRLIEFGRFAAQDREKAWRRETGDLYVPGRPVECLRTPTARFLATHPR
jgi:hypothetical protein